MNNKIFTIFLAMFSFMSANSLLANYEKRVLAFKKLPIMIDQAIDEKDWKKASNLMNYMEKYVKFFDRFIEGQSKQQIIPIVQPRNGSISKEYIQKSLLSKFKNDKKLKIRDLNAYEVKEIKELYKKLDDENVKLTELEEDLLTAMPLDIEMQLAMQ